MKSNSILLNKDFENHLKSENKETIECTIWLPNIKNIIKKLWKNIFVNY